MKHLALVTSALVLTLLPARAVWVDAEAFGAALHGWRKDHTAVYSINNNTYRTHRPTATATENGGVFLSTRIEEGGRMSKGAVSFLELTFTAQGHLVAAQIRATMGGKRLDTGLVTRRPDAPDPVVPEQGPAEVGPAWETPTTALVNDLFTRLDAELGKLDAKEGEKPRRDIFGRLTGGANKRSDVPAALRHNLNLLLAHVHPGAWRGK